LIRAWLAGAPDCPEAEKEKTERSAQQGETGGLGQRSPGDRHGFAGGGKSTDEDKRVDGG